MVKCLTKPYLNHFFDWKMLIDRNSIVGGTVRTKSLEISAVLCKLNFVNRLQNCAMVNLRNGKKNPGFSMVNDPSKTGFISLVALYQVY